MALSEIYICNFTFKNWDNFRDMMVHVFLSVLFLVGSALGTQPANQYFESVLNTSLQRELNISRLNPTIIPGFVTKFAVKVPIIGRVKGEAEYIRGNLTGLAQVRRYSECQGPYVNRTGSKWVNCTIGFDRLHLKYEGTLKYGKLPKVNIEGNSDLFSTSVFIAVSSAPSSSQGTLSTFSLQNMGGLEVKFSGLGPLNKYTEFLEPDYILHAQRAVHFYLTEAFKRALNSALASVPMPN